MERMNRLMDNILRHYVCDTQSDWDAHIQMAVLARNNAVNESLGNTPFCEQRCASPHAHFCLCWHICSVICCCSGCIHVICGHAKNHWHGSAAKPRQKAAAEWHHRDLLCFG